MTISFSPSRASRVALGILLMTVGCNFFGNFLPQETMTLPSRYYLGFIGIYDLSDFIYSSFQILAGCLLITNMLVPFILLLQLPWVINLTSYHLEASQHLIPVITIAVTYLFLLFSNRKTFLYLLQGNNE
tara:strand:+ start:10920 stop:11309 length:390 start_codon:yes stop_codon:yes gene_type:complete